MRRVLVPPPSKSDAQRALASAFALGRGDLAPPIDLEEAPTDVGVLARGLETLRAGSGTIDCGDGGLPFRLLLALAAVSEGGPLRFIGAERLGARPHEALLEALREGGARIRTSERFWPLEVEPMRAPRGAFRVDASKSSQFASALLFAAATRACREGRPWSLTLEGLASPGYLDLTLLWLERAGFLLSRDAGEIRAAPPREVPCSLPPIPGDWSSIGYLLLLAWKSGALVSGIDRTASHPDRAILSVLSEVGLEFEEPGPGLMGVRGRASRGITRSAADAPDLIPALVALAAVLPEPSRFTDVGVLRGKESDRVVGLIELIEAAGGRAWIDGSGALGVDPPRSPPSLIEVASHHDHRLALAGATLAALLGVRSRCDDPGCVAKSFPKFWEALG